MYANDKDGDDQINLLNSARGPAFRNFTSGKGGEGPRNYTADVADF